MQSKCKSGSILSEKIEEDDEQRSEISREKFLSWFGWVAAVFSLFLSLKRCRDRSVLGKEKDIIFKNKKNKKMYN